MIYGLKDETVTQRQRVEGAERGEGRLLTEKDREGRSHGWRHLVFRPLVGVGRCWKTIARRHTS